MADGLKKFLDALKSSGQLCSTLMQSIPGVTYYRCRGLFLQHCFGDFTTSKAWAQLSQKEQRCWEPHVGTIQQDAFAALLKEFNAFKNDLSF